MSRFAKVSSGQLLAFLLLVFAWTTCLTSLVTADWGRSVVRRREPSFTHFVPKKIKVASVHVNGTSLHWGIAHRHKGRNISLVRAYRNATRVARRVYVKRWFTVGYKGLWQECIYIQPYKDNVAHGIPSRYNPPNSSIAVTYGVAAPQVSAVEEVTTAVEHSQGYDSVTQLPRHVVVITPKFMLQNKPRFPAESREETKRDCTAIPLKKASCLLLSIRTMFSLGLLGGLSCVAIALLSIAVDKEIREYSDNHPKKRYFDRRNVLSVLGSAVASLSGFLILMSCWWFTLDTNLSFLMPSYQDYHNKRGAFFVAGTGILTAVTSGVSYFLSAVLLGWSALAGKLKWKGSRYETPVDNSSF